MTNLFSVSGVARRLEEKHGCPVRPRDISALLYDRVIDDARCPVVGGRRVIPGELLPEIEEELVKRGTLIAAKREASTDG